MIGTETIISLFKQIAQQYGDKPAVVYNEHAISYHKLDSLTSAGTQRLIDSGISPGQPIAFFLNRSIEAILTILAILKAGCIYVPIDTSYPKKRISFMLKDCQPATLITTLNDSKHLVPTEIPIQFVEDIFHSAAPEYVPQNLPACYSNDPAYIIYTSGTTGTPKGVIIPHRGVTRLVSGQNYIDFGPRKKFLQLASLGFDAATFEIWGPLLNGGTCVIYPFGDIPDPSLLQKVIIKHQVTTIWLTATLFNTLIATDSKCLKNVKEILTGGEALSPPHVKKALRDLPGTKIINGYGPTENTTFTTCYNIPKHLPADCKSIPIGTPLNGTTTYIFDPDLKPVPPGKTGELFVGGTGLALGYLNRPDLNREKFIPNPDTDSKDKILYRTGDTVRLLPDGNIDYVGRIDDQIKIRGFRIEPAEIRTAILKNEKIKDAAITIYTDSHQQKKIAAYYVSNQPEVSEATLRNQLSDDLPDYMLPACFIKIDVIPMNSSGKLDKSKLPPPSPEKLHNHIAPGSNIEKQLAEIWSEVLRVRNISITDNFFDAGGTSLLAITLTHKLNQSLGLTPSMPPVTIFQFPTIKSLARHIQALSPPSSNDNADDIRITRQKTAFAKFKKNRK